MRVAGIICLVITCRMAAAQSTAGITRQPDTSFTTFSAYTKALKKHPGITIVNEFDLPGIATDSNIIYCRLGERELKLDAFYPAKKDSLLHPAIIIIHGGGWRSGSRRQHYPLAQQLAALGYACFTPEYRLSTEALYPAAIVDMKAAIRWVKMNAVLYNVDSNKIAVSGFSAGGQIAAYLGTTGDNSLWGEDCNSAAGNAVNAVIDIDGTLSFVHPESGEGDDSKKTSAATYWFGYSKKENPLLWEEASPLKWVGSKTPPVLFINSAEKRMYAGREDFINVLKENNIYAEVHAFDNAPHAFCLFHPWFEPTVKYIDNFLKTVFTK